MEKLTILDRAIRLQKVELFSDLETELLALIASIAKQNQVEAGQTLVERDHVLDALYVVLEGRIDMERGGRTLFTVGPDETIGNWALFDRQPSVVRAVAAEPTWLLRIDREDFYDMLADHSEMTRELFFALFKRVRSLLAAGLGSSTEGGS
jgi:CRP-like cAMP-binding protein